MGSLSDDERVTFESLLNSDPATQKLVAEISDDWSSLALLSSSSKPDSDLRSRTLMLVEEPSDLSPFIESKELDTLRENFSKPSNRYLGGDGTVDTNEIKNSDHKDCISRTYEQLLGILPLVNGESLLPSAIFLLCKISPLKVSPSRINSVNGRPSLSHR